MPKRLRSSWGSVRKIGEGRWQLRWQGLDGGTYRPMSMVVRGTRRDADDKLAELRLRYGRDAPAPTVAAMWSAWTLPRLERMVDDGELSAETLKKYLAAWEYRVSPQWGDVQVTAIRPLDVQQWLMQYPATTARRCLSTLSQVCDDAVLYDYMPANVCERKYTFTKPTERKDAGVWSAAELAEMWSHLRGTWMEPAFLLSAYGSARQGESLGVHGCEVRYAEGCAIVPIVRQMDAYAHVSDRLKTKQSRRTICIPGPMGERLVELADGRDWLVGDTLPAGSHALWRDFRREYPERPIKQLRASWATMALHDWRLPTDLVERLMGHVSRDHRVLSCHYDRMGDDAIAREVSAAYGNFMDETANNRR